MLNLNENYLHETYNQNGELVDISIDVPEDFNFGYDVVDEIADKDPDRTALVWCNPEGEEHVFTFADMKYWSNRTASFFHAYGIGRGDKVLVVLRRHYQFWFVATALHKLGAVLVPATFMLKEHDLQYRLNFGEIKAVVATNVGDIAQVVDNVEDRCPSLMLKFLVNGAGGGLSPRDEEGNFILDGSLRDDTCGVDVGPALSGPDGVCKVPVEREGWIDFNSSMFISSPDFVPLETSASEPSLMYFSSGTTGNPKLVTHNSGYALAHTITAKHWHCVQSEGGLHFTIADTGWGKAVWGKYYGQWIMEAAVLCYDFDRFNAHELLSLVEKYHVTTMCCPATMYRMFMLQNIDNYDLSSLVHCTTAGEALNPDLFDSWKKHTGLTIFEGFGQTETPLTIANLRGSSPVAGSMGKPVPLYTMEIHRADGSVCDPDETGEICIKMTGNTPGITMGYFNAPTKNKQAFRGGWYHTGDTAYKDESGRLWYVGRNDDVIKSNGYRIGPFEIESVMLNHAAVSECAVTGVPDPMHGQVVKATIVLTDGFTGSDELTAELQAFVKEKTAPYKYPRVIEYVDELPRTVNGKIRRSAIRKNDKKAAASAVACA